MILPDVNVLLSALRPDVPGHAECRRLLEEAAENAPPFGVSTEALSSVIRISTSPRVFKEPTPLAEVLEYCNALLKCENCRPLQPGPRHWLIFEGLCRQTGAKGNLVPDAWFAALAIEWGCEWITMDRGFAVFPGLQWRLPAPAA